MKTNFLIYSIFNVIGVDTITPITLNYHCILDDKIINEWDGGHSGFVDCKSITIILNNRDHVYNFSDDEKDLIFNGIDQINNIYFSSSELVDRWPFGWPSHNSRTNLSKIINHVYPYNGLFLNAFQISISKVLKLPEYNLDNYFYIGDDVEEFMKMVFKDTISKLKLSISIYKKESFNLLRN